MSVGDFNLGVMGGTSGATGTVTVIAQIRLRVVAVPSIRLRVRGEAQ